MCSAVYYVWVRTGRGLLSGFPVSTRNSRSSAERKVAKNTASRGSPWNNRGEYSKEHGLSFVGNDPVLLRIDVFLPHKELETVQK